MILEKGKVVDIPLPEAVKKLKAGDVVMKGANALDYKNKMAAVDIFVSPLFGVPGPDGGTTGVTMPYIVARKVYLVIPVGLEKQVAGDLVDLTLKMREPMESLDVRMIPSMWLLTGEIVTELEAIKILTGATAFQCQCRGCRRCGRGIMACFQRNPGSSTEGLGIGKIRERGTTLH